MNHKDTLKVIALKERIAYITADYEDKLADVRADFTMAVEEMSEQIKTLQADNEALKKRLEDVAEKED